MAIPARLVVVLSFAVSYYLAARLGLSFRFQNSQVGVVWPPAGLLLAALLLTRPSRWWMVLLSAAIAHAVAMFSAVPVWRWSWQIVGNAVFAITTVIVIRCVAGPSLDFGTRRQVVVYMAVTFLLPALFGFTTPAFVRSLLG